MGFNSKFLVQNRFGVFYFQKRVPNCYLIKSPSLPKLVRLSLGTKSKRLTVIKHLVNEKKIYPNRIAIGFCQKPVWSVTQTVYTKRQSTSSYFQYFDMIDFGATINPR